MKNVIIVGGGIAGLITAICLARKNISTTVIEKGDYPAHRVCGEYVSNEVLPFLQSLGLYPFNFEVPRIDRFQLSATNGRTAQLPLDLGGFGISRYSFDQHLYEHAKQVGVQFLLDTTVNTLTFSQNTFLVKAGTREIEADIVIGAHGKRSVLDRQMQRSFIKKRSPFMAAKYHLQTDLPDNLIALHNFQGGYCGISKVENNVTNLCYLAHRDTVRNAGDLPSFERDVLCKNPLLKHIFDNSHFLFDKPLTIGEVSFATKGPVEDHVLMAGDAAGMIAPLCGNGMSMAVHSAKLVSETIIRYATAKSFSRAVLESHYTEQWRKNFANRLWLGRQMQRLFGNHAASSVAVNLALYIKPLARQLVRNSHGQPF